MHFPHRCTPMFVVSLRYGYICQAFMSIFFGNVMKSGINLHSAPNSSYMDLIRFSFLVVEMLKRKFLLTKYFGWPRSVGMTPLGSEIRSKASRRFSAMADLKESLGYAYKFSGCTGCRFMNPQKAYGVLTVQLTDFGLSSLKLHTDLQSHLRQYTTEGKPKMNH